MTHRTFRFLFFPLLYLAHRPHLCVRRFSFHLITLTTLSISPGTSQWLEQPFPSGEYLWGVRFVDESHGWIFGHEFVYGTTDGGMTWIAQDSSLGAIEAFYAL